LLLWADEALSIPRRNYEEENHRICAFHAFAAFNRICSGARRHAASNAYSRSAMKLISL
jgi:hypothetical protein